MAELTALVTLAMCEVTDSRSEPVAVDSTELRLDRSLAAPLVMEPMCEEASDRAELSDELREERAEEGVVVMVAAGVVVVVCWACLWGDGVVRCGYGMGVGRGGW